MQQLYWVKSDGTAVGGSLANGVTYYTEIPGDSTMLSASLTWDASVIFTATIEGCNLETATRHAAVGSSGWFKRDSLGSITAAGGSAGSDAFDLVGTPCGRYRIKIVIGGTGGVVTVNHHGKS